MRFRRMLLTVTTIVAVTIPQAALVAASDPSIGLPTPPTQPATGPGGAEYAFDSVSANHYGPEPDGAVPATGFWIFEPSDPGSAGSAQGFPLVLFFHSLFGADPAHYRAWIDHIVRRGAIVVYPDFQPTGRSLDRVCGQSCAEPTLHTFQNATNGIRGAISELGNGTHDTVDLTRVAAIGHAWGGML